MRYGRGMRGVKRRNRVYIPNQAFFGSGGSKQSFANPLHLTDAGASLDAQLHTHQHVQAAVCVNFHFGHMQGARDDNKALGCFVEQKGIHRGVEVHQNLPRGQSSLGPRAATHVLAMSQIIGV